MKKYLVKYKRGTNFHKESEMNALKKKVSKISKTVKQNDLSEVRYLLQQSAQGHVTQAGTLTLLNGMGLGDTDGTRQGNRIHMKRLRLSCNVIPVGNVAAATYDFRLMLLYDSQPNGAIMATPDFLANGAAAANNFFAQLNPRNCFGRKHRFKVLYDKHFSGSNIRPSSNTSPVTQAGVGGEYVPNPVYKINKKLNLDTIQIAGQNNGTIVDIESGALWAFVCTFDANNNMDFRHNFTLEYEP